jgi:hypothetical protein
MIEVNLVFQAAPSVLGVTGTAPQSISVPTGATPQINDVLGFAALRLSNGNVAMFRVVNRFLSFDSQGILTHIHIVLALEADVSFLRS